MPIPPVTPTSETSLQTWRDLFRARQEWAVQLAASLNPYRDIIRRALEEADNIQWASSLALDNLQSHVDTLRRKHEDKSGNVRTAIQDYNNLLRDWASNLQVLARIPANDGYAFLLQGPRTPTKMTARRALSVDTMLSTFVDPDEIELAASDLAKNVRDLDARLQSLNTAMERIVQDTEDAETIIRQPESGQEESQGLQELFAAVEALTRQVKLDFEELSHPSDEKQLTSTALRRSRNHKQELLPLLRKTAEKITELAERAVFRRNARLDSSVQALHKISAVQSNLLNFQSQSGDLGKASGHFEAYDVVHRVFDLPTIYGSVLIESVRRADWIAKYKTEADRLKQDIKVENDRESRRRKKWFKKMGGLIAENPEPSISRIDISLLDADETWPLSDRRQVQTYIQALRTAQVDDAAEYLTQSLKEIDSPRTSRDRPRAFKSGSVHDAAIQPDRSSLLLPEEGDEAVKDLRLENSRLEDKLRASDSRIRKLEDLLHRQGQSNRASATNLGGKPAEPDRRAPSPGSAASPRANGPMSRRSSVSSRRLSSNQNPDEKLLVQRIVGLEADLRAERDATQRLQREAQIDRRASEESRDRLSEAESTKKDLLANLDAQRQEHEDERQLLEDELHKLKIRLEEVEDELDRVVGSRDHHATTTDAVIAQLHADLDRLRMESSQQMSRLHEQEEALRTDMKAECDRAQRCVEAQDAAEQESRKLEEQLKSHMETEAEYRSSLQAAHLHLSPAGAAPEDLRRLISAIETLAEGMAIHTRSTDEAAQLAISEKKAVEDELEETQNQLSSLQENFHSSEARAATLQAALRQQLDIAREEKQVQTRFMGHEKASVDVDDGKHPSPSTDITVEPREPVGTAISTPQKLEEESSAWTDKTSSLDSQTAHLREQLRVSGDRAQDLSRRLAASSDRMVRMLEQSGFSLVRHDDRVTIERSSKINASSVLSPEGPNSTRSLPAPASLPPSALAPVDPGLVHWTAEPEAAVLEEKFSQFISTLSLVDTDAAAEMITKRHKDVETLARKYQKDCRAYREKAHRWHSEAQDKIAYRSFKEGDLALFLPTRNQATRPWAAFNVGAPHYFLREQDAHRLQTRDWLLARIGKVEERVVDLSKSLANGQTYAGPLHNGGIKSNDESSVAAVDRRSINTDASDHTSMKSVDEENPFELSDGLRWYLIDATEEKPGSVPVLTPGLGKSTVAATNVDARGSIRLTKDGKPKPRDANSGGGNGMGGGSGGGTGNGGHGSSAPMATKTLSKSLDNHSRRSSSASRRGQAASPSRAPSSTGPPPPPKTSAAQPASPKTNERGSQHKNKDDPSDGRVGGGGKADDGTADGDANAGAMYEPVRRDLLHSD